MKPPRLGQLSTGPARGSTRPLIDEAGEEVDEPGVVMSADISEVAFLDESGAVVPSEGRRAYPTLDVADGSVRWDEDATQVSMFRLVAAADAGLIDGDPRRIYVEPHIAAGGPGPFDWQAALTVLQHVIDSIERLGPVQALELIGGVYGGVEALSKLQGVIRRTLKRWSARGGSLGDVVALCTGSPRTAHETSRLLGVPREDAEVVLVSLGLSRSADGRFQVPDRREAQRIQRLHEVVESALYAGGLVYESHRPGELQAAVDEALRLLLLDGAERRDIQDVFLRRTNPWLDELDEDDD